MASLLVYLMISSPERGASMLESESLRSLHRDWEQYPRGRRQGAGRLLFVSTHRLPSTTHHCLAMPRVTMSQMSHCHNVTPSHHSFESRGEANVCPVKSRAVRWVRWPRPGWPHHTGKLLGTTNTRKCVEHCSTTPVLHSDGKGQHDWHDYKLSIPQPDTRNNHQGVLSAN